MRQFEIGNGLISIKVSNNYSAEQESDNTVLLYDPEIDFANIRISVISVETIDKTNTQPMFRWVCERAKEKGISVNIEGDKSYYSYIEENQEDDLTIIILEIGYLDHLIVISITSPSEFCQNNEESIEDVLYEIISFIPSIKEIDLKNQNIFEPIYTDFCNINQRIVEILKVREEDIDTYHHKDKTISIIQEAINKRIYQPQHTYELQSLGIALGDYIQYKYADFHWAVVSDEYGRDICLQYKTLPITIFPMTMISKRIEDGDDVDIIDLINNLLQKVRDLSVSEDFEELDYND